MRGNEMNTGVSYGGYESIGSDEYLCSQHTGRVGGNRRSRKEKNPSFMIVAPFLGWIDGHPGKKRMELY